MSSVRADAADGAEVEPQHEVPAHLEGRRHAPGGLQLARVALAVVEGERVALVALRPGDRERGGGVEPAGERITARSAIRRSPRPPEEDVQPRREPESVACRPRPPTGRAPPALPSGSPRAGGECARAAGRSARQGSSTSATSAASRDDELPPRLRGREGPDGAGLDAPLLGDPEPASLTETFHWIGNVATSGGGGSVPEVSTSMSQPRAWSAVSSGGEERRLEGLPAGDHGAPAGMRLHLGHAARRARWPGPVGSHEYSGVAPPRSRPSSPVAREDRRHPAVAPLALYRVEDFRDASRHGP